jgi:ribosomal protein L31E
MVRDVRIHLRARMVGVPFEQVAPTDVDLLREFLSEADLTLAGLDVATVRLWIERDVDGSIIGSTGYELSPTVCMR